SEATARYKATLDICNGETAIDITGGLGVDAAALTVKFEKFYYIDRNPVMCLMAGYNFKKLGIGNIVVNNNDGLKELAAFPDHSFDLIFADPSRRAGGRRVISLPNSIPDIPGNLDLLKRKARHILLKLSPMMDITETLRLLPGISVIDVVSHTGECKELLVILDTEKTDLEPVMIRATQLDALGGVSYSLNRPFHQKLQPESKAVGSYLYNPDPAFTKAGMIDVLCHAFDLFRLHAAVIYLTSDSLIPSFPGKIYQTRYVLPAHKRDIASYLKNNAIRQANIASRGFPETPELLYKRLKLKHGGNDFLFFTTGHNDQYIMIHSVPAEISTETN
ncbi:MAG TPA: hypothetical protein VKA08_18580, partial [Balneolales bacterium]|nr:hypothetical protein [Balneolales bacterium]